MTTRLLPPALFAVAIVSLTGCKPPDDPTDIRAPYVDEWVTEAELPAAQFGFLGIGYRVASDNFTNRGDIEVMYVAGATTIKVEMQRFTVASSEESAIEAFGRMQYWGYDKSSPEKPSTDLEPDACTNPEVDSCYIRAYYDGLFQPVRDGANFRVTIPAGWPGDLQIITSDNLEEGIDTYPDRSNVTVDGLNGNLTVDLDSGNVNVRLDPAIPHFTGCADSAQCEADGFPSTCTCTEPTTVIIANKNGQSSNITVDVGDATNWYTMILENNGMFSSSDDFVCNATIDCASFADCAIDPAYPMAYEERAEVNFPGGEAVEGTGIRISLTSESCSNIKYVEGIEDYGLEVLPEEKRGELRVCVGCL